MPQLKGNREMVRIGIAGLGFMGRIHFLAYRAVNGAQVAAVSSRDVAKLAGNWSNTRGNFGPEPGRVDLTGITPYADYAAMLRDPAIDLVDLCTPNHLHADAAIQALEAGKHVLVEKAIALTIADADRMVSAAAAAGRMLMVAHVLPFFPEFAFAAEAVRSGRYGKLLGAHFKRIIAQPTWSADFADADKSGGPAVDLHIHDTHFIGLIAGIPQRVHSFGRILGNAVNYLTTHYDYGAGGPVVTCSSGAIAAGRPFVHGYEIYLEQATLAYDSAGIPVTVYAADGTSHQPTLPGDGDPVAAFTCELQAAVDAVVAGREEPLLSGTLARNALAMCLKECESVKLGKPVEVGVHGRVE